MKDKQCKTKWDIYQNRRVYCFSGDVCINLCCKLITFTLYRSSNLTMKALESAVLKEFSRLRHVPIWKSERPESIKGRDELKIYKIYPLGLTQRQALYTFKFDGDSDFKSHIEKNPCSKFEVMFVWLYIHLRSATSRVWTSENAAAAFIGSLGSRGSL